MFSYQMCAPRWLSQEWGGWRDCASVWRFAHRSLSDARLVSELASGESLGEACPALVSVMSGFIRRDRDLNCINSRLFPIVFWWNLQPIKAAQLRTEDSPRIPEDQLNKKEGEKKNHNVSATPPLYSPLSSSRFLLHLPFHQFLRVCRHWWCGHFLNWSALPSVTDRWRVWANYNSRERSPSPLPLFMMKKQIVR